MYEDEHGSPPSAASAWYTADLQRQATHSIYAAVGRDPSATERSFAEKREGHCAHMMTSVTPAAICESCKSIIGFRRNDNRPETTQLHGGASEGSPRQPRAARDESMARRASGG